MMVPSNAEVILDSYEGALQCSLEHILHLVP